jgi:ankyrin repeat protein
LNILYEKNINKLKQLIINGANVNEKDSDQITFLWLLIDLWQYDNNQDNRYTNDDIIDLIHLMMKNGLNVNEPGCLYGSTVLDKAAGKNNITLLELFIHEGTEINKKDTAHNTPLHTAAHNNHKKSVELLLFYDADYKAQNEDGETPYACATKYPEIQKILKNEKSVRKVILEQAQEKVFKGTVPYRAIQNRQYMGSHSRFSAFNRKPRRQEMAMITDK